MAEDRVQRRLAAILAADVVGYSRMMGEDEAGTLARLKALRRELFEPKTKQYRGRIFKITGDGALVEFKSAVDAVNSAIDIQRALAERGKGVAQDHHIQLRIGVSLGDVIVEGSDLYGNGVNVAARLEGLAEPGGICISGNVHEHVRGAVGLAFDDLGRQAIKNIAEPVRAYRVNLRGDGVAETDRQQADASTSLSDKPSIAVMPFTNLSGDPEQEVFADGLTEDIITALSASHAYPVIARNSTFAYKGTSPDLRKVAQELGVRYVIEGSVRRGGDRLRITAQLIDGATGRHIWAVNFDRRLADIFEIQDEITARIAATIQPTLERVEGKRYAAERTTNIDAWGYYQRAMLELHEYTAAANRRARQFAAKAIELDPDYALAYVPLAYSHYRDLRTGNSEDEGRSEALLYEAAQRALALDDMDAKSHWVMGLAYQASGDYEMSKSELGRALELNPYDAWMRFALGGTLVFTGDSEGAIPQLEKAFELNPQDTRVFMLATLLARAHLNARHYDDAAAWARRAIGYRANRVEAHLVVTSALGHLGRIREAQAELAECERLRPGSGQSGLLGERDSVTWETRKVIAKTAPADPLRNAHFLDGLRKAGLPE